MQRIFWIFLMAVPLLAGKLTWYHTYDQAMAQARAVHKNVYVFIDAPGCPYCERMRHSVLERPDVVRSLADYVLLNLKLNSRDTRKHFPHAQVTPTSYFVATDGTILLDFAGYTNEEFFFWRMADAERIAAARTNKQP